MGAHSRRARQFHDFAQVFVRRARRDDQAGLFDPRQVVVVGFVAMAVALGDDAAVDLGGQRARARLRRSARPGAWCRRGRSSRRAVSTLPSWFCHSLISATTGCSVSGSNSVRIGVGQAGHVARIFDQRHLHAQADAQVRNLVFAGVAGGSDLAFDAALAEAARHQDRVVLGQLRRCRSLRSLRSRGIRC